ncbi:hypothetical protein HT102_09980 [Hoyosella sp. G463]|uniref:Uncharacterized protein n=1 Tax=Lolliginicoccus lacisalsi TaxID=2742202 RepID=A0A927JCM0_9ACTN|nr:hypothetical protein [Lolliginicoccus lacisalsi]MBD8506816.1 hypothetical protein [Lolliginicoccus lacisalsi]
MNNMDGTAPPSATEADRLLGEARRLARSSHDAAWPWIAFLLGLGATTSMAFLAFGTTTRPDAPTAGNTAVVLGMLAWVGALMAFAIGRARGARRGFGRRWILYITAWAATYIIGLLIGSIWFAGNLAYWTIAATAVGVACIVGAVLESRRG